MRFKVLYREFLFRIVDLELLSKDAQGDSNKLLGRFAALLLFMSFLMAVPALGAGNGRGMPPFGMEHFLIATTMLTVGLFAVLAWDSTFLDRRDVYVLTPLPVRARTLFLAKVAASATGIVVTVACLHGLAGLAWPLAIGNQTKVDAPVMSYLPAVPPAGLSNIESMLQRDFAPVISDEMGVVAGIISRDEQRVFAYGTARPDSIYQIGSISKTFTGLLLARMVTEGKVRLDEPVRELLPPGTVSKPAGNEITLADLATHRSGLKPMPNNLRYKGLPNPGSDYQNADLYKYLSKTGVGRPAHPAFNYSNLGFAVLGQAVAARAGMSYEELLRQEVTGPLGMGDTALALTEDQLRRVVRSYNHRHELLQPWDIGALGPAGGIYSTAGDMLKYMRLQLEESPGAVRLSHERRGEVDAGHFIALAWIHDDESGVYWHNGAISGYRSHALFHPKDGFAAVVLSNMPQTVADWLPLYIEARLRGKPAISLASIAIPSSGFFGVPRMFVAYWMTMLLSGVFVFCSVLVLQGVAAQTLPRRLFLKASSFLQLAVFCAVVCVYALHPRVSGLSLADAAGGEGWLRWSPSFWFLGLLQQLNGSPALAGLASRAWLSLAVVMAATAMVYALSYFRTLRRIAEEPDILPGARRGAWLPPFGGLLQTAIVQFSIRTFLRSRRHRLILAFYLGIGLAFVILLVKIPELQQQAEDAPVSDPWDEVNAPALVASIAMMLFAIIGTRVVFALPIDLRANWIFRVTGVRGAMECLRGSRRSLYWLAVAPVWLLAAGACFWLWPWWQAAGHLAILGALAWIAAEVRLIGFRNLPFTCSYLPGKSQVHMVALGVIGLFQVLRLNVKYEQEALRDWRLTALVVALLALVGSGVRWWNQVAAARAGEVEFEDSEEPVIERLDLNRDGASEVVEVLKA